MSLLARLEQSVHENGGLIVSCQPVPGSPMDKPEIVAAMAQAAASAGAVAVRIEGIENLRTVRPHLSVPIIGIIKRDLTGSPVRITPYLQDVDALAQAGADIIAFDASFRSRPVDIDSLLTRIRLHGLLAMADCSTVNEGISCHQKGIEFIGTTLSGYTGPITPVEPDLAMVAMLVVVLLPRGAITRLHWRSMLLSMVPGQLPLVPLSPVSSISVSGSVTQ